MSVRSRNPGLRLAKVLAATAALLSASGAAGAQPSTIIVVRHAEKASAPASDPPLTAEGTQRAIDLAAAVSEAGVTHIITTQLQRSWLTAKPTADAIGKRPTVVTVGGTLSTHVDAVVAAIEALSGNDVALVVGHSNTVASIIAALGGPSMPDLCDNQYSMLFILHTRSGAPPRLVQARYGAPDPPGLDGCSRTMR